MQTLSIIISRCRLYQLLSIDADSINYYLQMQTLSIIIQRCRLYQLLSTIEMQTLSIIIYRCRLYQILSIEDADSINYYIQMQTLSIIVYRCRLYQLLSIDADSINEKPLQGDFKHSFVTQVSFACGFLDRLQLFNYFFTFQTYGPYWNIENSAFGFPKGSKFLKFTLDALFKSLELQTRKMNYFRTNFVYFCKHLLFKLNLWSKVGLKLDQENLTFHEGQSPSQQHLMPSTFFSYYIHLYLAQEAVNTKK